MENYWLIPLIFISCMSKGNFNAREPWLNYHDYTMGAYHLACARGPESLAHYQRVLQYSNSPYPYEGFLQLLYATGNFEAIGTLMPKLDEPFAQNIPIQLIFVQTLHELGRGQEADQRAIALQKQCKRSPELTFLAAQAHGKSSPMKGIEVIDEYLNEVPFQQRQHCLFWYLKSQFYNQLNNSDKATEFSKKSLELCPYLRQGSQVESMLRERHRRLKNPTRKITVPTSAKTPSESEIQRIMIQNLPQKSGWFPEQIFVC